jgi:hypothetical protein
MIKQNLEFDPEAKTERGHESSRDATIDHGIDSTHSRINSIVRTSAPEHKHDDHKEKPKAEEKPKDKPAHPEPSPAAHAEPEHVVHDLGATHDVPHSKMSFANKTGIGVTAGLGALTVAGAYPSALASIPLIGKIPYLVKAATWLNAGVHSLVSPLGLGTGTQAINTYMAGLPYIGVLPTAVGATLTGALAIPTALWGMGLAKSLITGKRYGGIDTGTSGIQGHPSQEYQAARRSSFVGVVNFGMPEIKDD